MKIGLGLTILSLLIACSPIPKSTAIPWYLPNRCLPDAIAMQAGLAKYRIPARVLIIRPQAKKAMGHAVTIYPYKGRTYAWCGTLGSVEVTPDPDPATVGFGWWLEWADHFSDWKHHTYGTAFFLE